MLRLVSSAFEEGGSIPSKFTCDGENVNPGLDIEGIPVGAVSLVLLVDDPDIPPFVKEKMGIGVFDHWTLFNIPVQNSTFSIAEDTVPEGAMVGKNSMGDSAYRGPCPPDKEHRYFFKLYALDAVLELDEQATKADVMNAMQRNNEEHVLESAVLMGRYARLSI